LNQKLEGNAQQVLSGHCRSLWSANGHERTDETGLEPAQSGDIAPDGMTTLALIDQYTFTRECIAAMLQTAGTHLRVVPYASCAEILTSNKQYDLILFHWDGRNGEAENDELTAKQFEAMTALGPVIVLSTAERPEFISSAFENGARGYIPVKNTPVALALEIIRLIKAGGTFVPLSGLPLRGTRSANEPARLITNRTLTPRETAVLKFLKQGKANKIIARELKLSENTVKAHVRSIMRKMKARNRTEIVCCAYTTSYPIADAA
jgi:DNA-binding NarL/FixJ family response regulator